MQTAVDDCIVCDFIDGTGEKTALETEVFFDASIKTTCCLALVGKNDILHFMFLHRVGSYFFRHVSYLQVFLEQKKLLKTGLNTAQFRTHIPMIVSETEDYFEKWGDSGVKSLFEAMSELIILTASRCLHGTEIREAMNEEVPRIPNYIISFATLEF